MRKQENLEVALGDLIAALIDETVQFVPGEKVTHRWLLTCSGTS
jgi:hypothetical protein